MILAMSRNQPLLAVIIPTFNEAENIIKLLRAVRRNIGSDDKIIVVDDDSPDGTTRLVKNYAKHVKDTYLVSRKNKRGRGSAVIDGFIYAARFAPDYFIEMDADFSHKPEDIPRLLSEVQKGKDVVIGSRYLNESKIENWPIKRRIFSRLANLYAKLVLQVPIADYTNGFRIYSRQAVKFLLSQKLSSAGYILLSETAYKLKEAGFTFGEIPIVFINRKRGISNLNFAEIKNAFWSVLQIRFTPHYDGAGFTKPS